jgi:hypothetical protein
MTDNELVITPHLMQSENAQLWFTVWYHVAPRDWNQMCEWLSEHYECAVCSLVHRKGFKMVFETREDLIAFVLQWS